MRGMPSVATDSTWVSPRWNRPVPCAVGRTPISADSGRMSAGPRPSMRTPSLTMRLRVTSFCNERNARFTATASSGKRRGASIVPTSSANVPASISVRRLLRSVLSAIFIASAVADSA